MISPKNVLFLCTGNSARSILAEALLTHLSDGRMQGFSAGSQPTGTPNPAALAWLEQRGIATDGFHSKSWDVFADEDAPEMDIVITVCDSAANEPCPYWPGAPLSGHWGLADPAAVSGSAGEIAAAFAEAAAIIEARITALLALPDNQITPAALERISALPETTTPQQKA